MCRWGSIYITIKDLSYTLFYVQPFSDPFTLQEFRKKKHYATHARRRVCLLGRGKSFDLVTIFAQVIWACLADKPWLKVLLADLV